MSRQHDCAETDIFKDALDSVDPWHSVCIGNIPLGWTEKNLKDLFTKFLSPENNVTLARGRQIALVQFEDSSGLLNELHYWCPEL